MPKNLTTDNELDTHLKPVKSGEVTTSLELASQDNGARVRGDLILTDNASVDGLLKVRSIELGKLDGYYIYFYGDGGIRSWGDSLNIQAGDSGGPDTMFVFKSGNGVQRFKVDDDGTDARFWFFGYNSTLIMLLMTVNTDGVLLQNTGDLHIDSSGIVKLDAGTATEGNGVQILMAGTKVGDITGHSSATQFRLYENVGASTDDYLNIAVAANGATTISTVDAASTTADLTLAPDGHLKVTVGAGRHVEFDGMGVGFDLDATTYDATDTFVRFDQGNKKTLTFGAGNITDLYTRFPATSGNFTLILKQDGTGSRTVTNWKVLDSGGADAGGSPIVKFAGGSNPTLTTDANHVDIISFFWDADTEIAYGVASLDFQF